jgi:hypothetical protein
MRRRRDAVSERKLSDFFLRNIVALLETAGRQRERRMALDGIACRCS